MRLRAGQLLAVATAALSFNAAAAVPVGENILINGALEADQVDFPPGWTFFPGGMVRPEWHPTGGPGGVPCVTFAHDAETPSGSRTMRQYGIRLASDGQYRISALVRPRAGFSAKTFRLLAINKGWHASRGVNGLPAVGKWTRVSETFGGFRSDGDYFFAVVLGDFRGAIDVADLRLEAVDDVGATGAERAKLSAFQSAPRIVPWGRLLGEIPKTTREVSLKFLGVLPDGVSHGDCDMVLSVDGAGGQSRRLTPEPNVFRLPDGADAGVLSASVVLRASGSNIVSRAFRYRTADVPSPETMRRHRRLNNYVTEVLRATLSADGKVMRTFGLARRKWVIIAVRSGADFTLSVDGAKVMDASTPRHEVFRELPSGDHLVTLDGGRAGDKVLVRIVPEILNYCPALSVVRENPPFDWEFQKRHALPAVTTMNGGTLPPTQGELDEFVASGHKWVANLHTTKPADADDIAARLASAKGMTDPRFCGVTCDEQFCGRDEVNSRYMLGLRKFDIEARPTRGVYTWLVGKPLSGVFDSEFLAECANAALGRGMVMTETYCRSRSTEAEAKTYIDTYVCESMRRFRSAWPEIMPSMGMVLGNFVQLPVLSLHHNCEMDYRYYLDMQLNALANAPGMDGIGLAGYWGSYYIDEETLRWSLRLLRHYCINGATDMLSARYGLKYNPGFVANPDFRKGLDGWHVDGDVSHDSVKEFGERSLGLYGGAGGRGDDFAVFTRGASPSRLSQIVRGLVPGETYVLQFVTFDARDAADHRFAPRRIALSADLGAGADRLPDRSWTHVDRRAKTRWGVKSDARVNLNRIVFAARASELELSFTDAEAAEGERIGLNWIYFAKYIK